MRRGSLAPLRGGLRRYFAISASAAIENAAPTTYDVTRRRLLRGPRMAACCTARANDDYATQACAAAAGDDDKCMIVDRAAATRVEASCGIVVVGVLSVTRAFLNRHASSRKAINYKARRRNAITLLCSLPHCLSSRRRPTLTSRASSRYPATTVAGKHPVAYPMSAPRAPLAMSN